MAMWTSAGATRWSGSMCGGGGTTLSADSDECGLAAPAMGERTPDVEVDRRRDNERGIGGNVDELVEALPLPAFDADEASEGGGVDVLSGVGELVSRSTTTLSDMPELESAEASASTAATSADSGSGYTSSTSMGPSYRTASTNCGKNQQSEAGVSARSRRTPAALTSGRPAKVAPSSGMAALTPPPAAHVDARLSACDA
mmetsp:Transcript_3429/g.11243  ORF Transcript_3429/g.11243 Transcript_3429/m.11243 type:complete len:200 (+) Transcript_3429:1222-1821(+)